MERAHAILDPIAAEYLERPGVDIGVMFGSEGLRIRGKVFAFVGFQGALALKLPAERVDELDGEDGMQRMVMRERAMREWLTVPARRRGAVGAAHRRGATPSSTRSRPDAAVPAARDNGRVTTTFELPGWRHVYSGKVRDLYVPDPRRAQDDGRRDRMLVVASDRVSAFDHVLSPGIPGKGVLLTTLSLWWFDQLAGADGGRGIPNHLAASTHALGAGDERDLAHPGSSSRDARWS